MSDNLIYEIDGIKYLLFAIPVTDKNKHNINTEVGMYDGIVQGIKEWKHGGLFTNSVVILNVLIPETKALDFHKHSKL